MSDGDAAKAALVQDGPRRRAPGAAVERGHASRLAAGASLSVPFGRLQKELARGGETGSRGRHDKQPDHPA
ncbi:TPA: hypothetical protein L6B08_20785 [Pseudomonas aeruginosa]|nr:hypothetical protein [Pseudomonas aeruginosa]HBP6464546.1 hypothetical protein [Pseudomonas aeruginosa]HBP6822313.1 hypothetical protein [Pseudomonas aeruginosa]